MSTNHFRNSTSSFKEHFSFFHMAPASPENFFIEVKQTLCFTLMKGFWGLYTVFAYSTP